jgi:hypothetical protein
MCPDRTCSSQAQQLAPREQPPEEVQVPGQLGQYNRQRHHARESRLSIHSAGTVTSSATSENHTKFAGP